MRRFLILFTLTLACQSLQAQTDLITTIAGNDTAGFGGEGGNSKNAMLYAPEGLCIDGWGNLYIADAGNNRVRKINSSTGIITTIAGDGTAAHGGDGGQATNSQLNIPEAVITDTAGNIYVAEGINCVRKIAVSTGIITTIIGNGTTGNAGDGGPATNAQLNAPSGLYIDNQGYIYVADYHNNKVRRVNTATGIITTFAGTGTPGYSGDNGPATDAELNGPIQVFSDHDDNIIIADSYNNVIRKVAAATGIITTIAGTGAAGYSGDGGLATTAQLDQPDGIYVDAFNNMFIAEYGNGTVRKIDATTGIITTVAGTGVKGYSGDGGPATSAMLQCSDVLLDSHGVMFIADYDNNRIRRVGPRDNTAARNVSLEGGVTVYPNPAGEYIKVHSTGAARAAVLRICDAAGRQALEQAISFSKGDITIPLRLESGVYMAEIYEASPGGVARCLANTRLVVER